MHYSINYETKRNKSDFTKTDLQKTQNIYPKSDATVTVEHTKFPLTSVGIKDTFSQYIRTQCAQKLLITLSPINQRRFIRISIFIYPNCKLYSSEL